MKKMWTCRMHERIDCQDGTLSDKTNKYGGTCMVLPGTSVFLLPKIVTHGASHLLTFQQDLPRPRYRKRFMIMKCSLFCRFIWFSCCLSLPFALCTSHVCSTVRACRELVPETNVPAVFTFGDALTDAGNNNNLITLLKSNFPPYGKDFEQGKPTGRFSNGRILSDFLAEAFGVKKNLPAYLDPNLQENDLLTGVSFASTGGGFDDVAATVYLAKSMKDQLKMLEGYIGKVQELVGNERTDFIVNNSVYFAESGTADLIIYFDSPVRRIEYDVNSYTDLLLLSATSFVKKLYTLGARKIAVSNIPAAGCTPLQRTLGGGLARECAEDYNDAAQLFNTKLAAELELLIPILPGSILVYVDLYSIVLDLIENAASYGLPLLTSGNSIVAVIPIAIGVAYFRGEVRRFLIVCEKCAGKSQWRNLELRSICQHISTLF